MNNLHKEFVRLGRERNQITYKLLALLPKILEQKIYEQEGYANIYDYAARIAGLSPGVVGKALKLEEKLQNMPHLQKVIETQGINKVGIVAGLATVENEKALAEKVEHMSKPALQEYSKEIRGKVTVGWQVELDQNMMFMFLKLKKKLGKNLSNKECLRKILEEMQEKSGRIMGEKPRSQRQGREPAKIPGEKSGQVTDKKPKPWRQASESAKILTATVPPRMGSSTGQTGGKILPTERTGKVSELSEKKLKAPKQPRKATRYISVHQKRKLDEHCSHPGCHRPAEVIHHPDRFSQNSNHKNLKPLCRRHHEFAHNGISEPMRPADYKYRKYRQAALV